MKIIAKRIYEPISDSDGCRVLIDRLWPRGISKQTASVDIWLKQIAPSADLRKWFGHEPERFKKFSELYKKELYHNPAVKELLGITANNKHVTLLYAAHDVKYNHAVVLLRFLADRQKSFKS